MCFMCIVLLFFNKRGFQVNNFLFLFFFLQQWPPPPVCVQPSSFKYFAHSEITRLRERHQVTWPSPPTVLIIFSLSPSRSQRLFLRCTFPKMTKSYAFFFFLDFIFCGQQSAVIMLMTSVIRRLSNLSNIFELYCCCCWWVVLTQWINHKVDGVST